MQLTSTLKSIKQDIADINWLLQIRSLSPKEKLNKVFNQRSEDTKRIAKHYWAHSVEQLKERRDMLELEIDKRISLVEHHIYS